MEQTQPTGDERRREVRVRSANLINYSSGGGPEGPSAQRVYDLLGTARTEDLSATGCRLITQEALPASLELTLDLQLGEHVVRCRGRAVRTNPVEGGYETGIAFSELDELAQGGIRAYLEFMGE